MKSILNILAFLFFSIAAVAQYATLNFGNYSSRNGLSNDYVEEIVVDHRGYVWVATWDGINRFDGKNWKIYKHSETNKNSILSNGTISLHQDFHNRLWVGTRHGISYYDEKKDVFITPEFTCNRKNSDRILQIYTDPTNSDVLFCSVQGIIRYSYSKNKFLHFVDDSLSKANQVPAVSLYFDSNNLLYIGTMGSGFWKLNPKTKEFTRINSNNACIFDHPLMYIVDFTKIADNRLLLATSKGIIEFNTQNNQIISQRDKDTLIKSFHTDDRQNIWVTKVNAPLEIMNRQLITNKKIETFYSNGHCQNYNTTTVVREDAMGNLWIGTHGNGIFYVDKFQNSILSYTTTTPLPRPLLSNIVSCFLERPDGKVWLGSDGGGLHLFDPRTSTFLPYNLFKSKAILDIKSAPNNKLWVATYGGGLNLFDPQTKKVKTFMLNKNGTGNFPCNDVKCLTNSGDSLLYIGFMGFGFGIFDIRTGKMKHIMNDRRLFQLFQNNRWCTNIFIDRRKRVWIGTSGGVCIKENERYTLYQNDSSTTSLSDNSVNLTFQDSQGRIFVGTNNGFDLWNEQNHCFIRLKEKLALPENCKSIEEDVYGNLWLSTNAGIVKVDKQLKKVDRYDDKDGLTGNQFFAPSSMKDGKGKLYFGGLSGFSIIDPKTAIQVNIQTPIVFTDFQVFNKSQLPNTSGSLLTRDINFTDTITLQYNQSVFSFEFGSLDVLGASKVQFLYKLDNFDKEWYTADKSNKVTYTNLDPGFYTLQVQSSNRFGKWDKPSFKSIYIHILTPWWLSWWFRLLVISVVGSYIAYEIRKYRRRHIKLASMVRERTRELQQSNEELRQQYEITQAQSCELIEKNSEIEAQKEQIEDQNVFLTQSNEKLENTVRTKDKFMSIIGHDLKNPIGAVIGIAELANSHYEQLSDTKKQLFFKTIYSSAVSIHELLESLLLWARTQTGGVEYMPEDIKIEEIISSVVTLLNDSAVKKDITLENYVQEGCTVFADKNMLNTIIRNLVSNAIKFTPKEGKVSVTVSKNENQKVCITIADTGLGMTEDQMSKLFQIGKTRSTNGTENETGTGLGLILCSEFLKLHDSKFVVKSELEKGTEFSFEL